MRTKLNFGKFNDTLTNGYALLSSVRGSAVIHRNFLLSFHELQWFSTGGPAFGPVNIAIWHRVNRSDTPHQPVKRINGQQYARNCLRSILFTIRV